MSGDWAAWVGRAEQARDRLTPWLAQAFCATFDLAPAPLPPGLHWCLGRPVAAGAALGADGHPALGGFLPPVALPRRMWASGAVQFHDELRVDDEVTRDTRIADIAFKQGASGPLCFITLDHELRTARGLCITEQQSLVYREAGVATPPAGAPAPPAPRWRAPVAPGPVLLFRYSALTFNAHRIHYDRAYATDVEHYDGLVVHGPLLATLLMQFAARCAGRPPRQFSFRALRPVIDSADAHLCADQDGERLSLWVETNNQIAMRAECAFEL